MCVTSLDKEPHSQFPCVNRLWNFSRLSRLQITFQREKAGSSSGDFTSPPSEGNKQQLARCYSSFQSESNTPTISTETEELWIRYLCLKEKWSPGGKWSAAPFSQLRQHIHIHIATVTVVTLSANRKSCLVNVSEPLHCPSYHLGTMSTWQAEQIIHRRLALTPSSSSYLLTLSKRCCVLIAKDESNWDGYISLLKQNIELFLHKPRNREYQNIWSSANPKKNYLY